VSSVEGADLQVHTSRSKTAFIGGDFFWRIPLVLISAADQDRRNARQNGWFYFRRNISPQGDHSPDCPADRRRSTKCHRDPLRKSRQNKWTGNITLFRGSINDFRNIGTVVLNGKCAILARHPTRYNLVATPSIKAVKALDCKYGPAVRTW